MLKTFAQCPKKYDYSYVQKIRVPENSKKNQNTLTGNKVHSLINFQLKNQNISKLRDCLDEEEKFMMNNFVALNLDNCLESEYSFMLKFSALQYSQLTPSTENIPSSGGQQGDKNYLPLKHYILAGRIDALFKTETSEDSKTKYLIADWKTSEYILDEKEQFQADFYLFCIYEILKAKGLVSSFEELSLKYFILSSSKEITIEFNKDKYEKFENTVRALILKIEATVDFEKNLTECRFCPYKKLCD